MAKSPAVATFAPQFIEAWVRAATKPVVIELPNHKVAVRMRHRLYTLRRSLLAEGHEAASAAQRVSIQLKQTGETYQLILAPADTEMLQHLDAADVSIPEPPKLEL